MNYGTFCVTGNELNAVMYTSLTQRRTLLIGPTLSGFKRLVLMKIQKILCNPICFYSKFKL